MQYRLGLLFLAVCIPLFVSGCDKASVADCHTRQCLLEAIERNPVRRLAFWESRLARPMSERMGEVPDELLEYLGIDNKLYGFIAEPQKLDDDHALRILKDAYQSLPARVHELMQSRLAGIYLVKDMGSSGYTESILDTEGRPVAGVIVLDAVLFEKTANAWASWKDSTPFRKDEKYQIKTTIAEGAGDTVLGAIQFLLLHELGHVYSIGSDVHPHWHDDIQEGDLSRFPFASLSWKISQPGNVYRSRYDGQFWQRDKLVYYREPELDARQMMSTLQQLAETDFVSLYAATAPEEDFAESFAIYVHTELMQRPYRTEVLIDAVSRIEIQSCFHSRCRIKLEIMKRIFDS